MNMGNLATVFAAVITTATMATFGHARTAPGMSTAHETIAAGATNAYHVALEPSVQTTIDVRGNGATDLDCYVVDPQGDVIAKDDSLSDHCRLAFTPSDTGKVTLRVVNRGAVANDFVVSGK